MGWTTFYVGFEKNRKELMTTELERYGDTKILKCSMRGNVYYAAYSNKAHPENVRAIICLTQLKDGDFSYKDMDESMHPYYYDCPKSILKLLTATDNELANEWRKNCIEKQSRTTTLNALPLGTVIEVDGVQYVKCPPAYQFKTNFWKCVDKFAYLPKKQIIDYALIK